MPPLLSLITINFNNTIGLEKTISSVVNQTFDNYEYIIIDGGSKDNSVAVIQNYQAQIKYWISEKDSGIYNAMNKGIKIATGDYLLFLNSGDVLTSNNTLQDFILNKDFAGDIIYGDYQFENGNKIYPDQLTPYYFINSSLPHQSTFFKKNVFKKMGGFDESYEICADRAFYLKCMISNQFIWQHIHYPVTLFDLEGISNNPEQLKKKQEEDVRLWKDNFGVFYVDYMRLHSLKNEIKQAERKALKGLLLRVKNRIKKLCNIR